MPDIRSKALGYLRDAKVTVIHAITVKPALHPHLVSAIVQGHTDRYWVRYTGAWLCSCPAPWNDTYCAHIAAVQLVTGHPSAAARPVKAAKAVAP